MNAFTLTNLCNTCNGRVYFAEEMRSMGKLFHRKCFKCYICNKVLDSYSVNDHGGKLFCQACYSKNFGPKGYRSGSIPLPSIAHVNSEEIKGNKMSNHRSHSQPRQVFPPGYSQNQINKSVRPEHNSYTNGSHHHSTLGSKNYDGRTPYSCRESQLHGNRPSKSHWVSSIVGGVQCANCADTVYANERVDVAGRTFHRLCFKCANCAKLLDRGTVCDHKRDIFCKGCYTRLFGSTGLKAGTNLRCG